MFIIFSISEIFPCALLGIDKIEATEESSSIFMSGEFKLLEEARAAMFLLELSSTEAIAFAFVKSNFNACFELKSVSEAPSDD